MRSWLAPSRHEALVLTSWLVRRRTNWLDLICQGIQIRGGDVAHVAAEVVSYLLSGLRSVLTDQESKPQPQRAPEAPHRIARNGEIKHSPDDMDPP